MSTTNGGQKIDWRDLAKCIKNSKISDGKIEGKICPLMRIPAKGERISEKINSLLKLLREKRPELYRSFIVKKKRNGNGCKKK